MYQDRKDLIKQKQSQYTKITFVAMLIGIYYIIIGFNYALGNIQ